MMIPILSLKKNHSYYQSHYCQVYLVDKLPKFEDFSKFDYLDESDKLQETEGRGGVELLEEASHGHRVEEAS